MIAHLKARLAAYKAPREIQFVPEIPKTSTGKTLKTALRATEWSDATLRIQG
jgi:fatty-acyl-CoA synthase